MVGIVFRSGINAFYRAPTDIESRGAGRSSQKDCHRQGLSRLDIMIIYVHMYEILYQPMTDRAKSQLSGMWCVRIAHKSS